MNNSPALERDYRNSGRARECHARATNAPPAVQEALLRDGFGALRTSYEAFIIFDLLNEVVVRFHERLSFGRLRDIVWEPSVVEQIVASCERLSRHIEGHLRSDSMGAVRPSPGLLMQEIESFDRLRRQLRDLKKDRRIA